MDDGERHRFEVLHALANYQLVEELIKQYLSLHFEVVRLLLDKRLYFGFDAADYDRSPLQGLVPLFGKVCNNKRLLEKLKTAIKHSDNLAHRALRNYWEDTSQYDFKELLAEIQPTKEQYMLISGVASEIRRLEAVKKEHENAQVSEREA
jgi:hypothetical protein